MKARVLHTSGPASEVNKVFDDIAGDNRSTEPSNGPVYGRKQNSTSGRRAAGALWIKEVTSHIQRHIVKLLNLLANATIPPCEMSQTTHSA